MYKIIQVGLRQSKLSIRTIKMVLIPFIKKYFLTNAAKMLNICQNYFNKN